MGTTKGGGGQDVLVLLVGLLVLSTLDHCCMYQ